MSCKVCFDTGYVIFGTLETPEPGQPCNAEPERNEFGRWETPAMTARAWARNEGRKHP